MKLANYEFLQLEEVTKKNIHECLTFLSYARERDEVADYEVKQKFNKKKR